MNFSLYHFNKDSSDKIWGWIKTDDGALSFWGRTKGTLAFKVYSSVYEVTKVERSKRDKGYKFVGNDANDTTVLPDDFKGQFLLAKLGQVKFA
jgi:hypothetical protein